MCAVGEVTHAVDGLGGDSDSCTGIFPTPLVGDLIVFLARRLFAVGRIWLHWMVWLVGFIEGKRGEEMMWAET